LPQPARATKKPDGVPFIKTEKRTYEMQCAIQEHHFSTKPQLFNIYNTYQLT